MVSWSARSSDCVALAEGGWFIILSRISILLLYKSSSDVMGIASLPALASSEEVRRESEMVFGSTDSYSSCASSSTKRIFLEHIGHSSLRDRHCIMH